MHERPRASATTAGAVDERLPHAGADVASVEVPAAEVLITEPEVVFGTAAAVAPRRQGADRQLLTSLWRVLAGSTTASQRRRYFPPYYLERPPVA